MIALLFTWRFFTVKVPDIPGETFPPVKISSSAPSAPHHVWGPSPHAAATSHAWHGGDR